MKIVTMTVANSLMGERVREVTKNPNATFNTAENVMEWCARSCYDSVSEYGSNPNFMRGILKSQHWDILEHGYLAAILKPEHDAWEKRYYFSHILRKAHSYMGVDFVDDEILLYGNLRVWYEMMQYDAPYLDGVIWKYDLNACRYVLSRLAPSLFAEPDLTGMLRNYLEDDYREAHYHMLDAANLQLFHNPTKAVEYTPYGAEVMPIAVAPQVEGYGYYTFQFSDVSRAFMAQHTRHRRMVHSVRSFRYVDASNTFYVHDLDETPEQYEIAEAAHKVALLFYEQMRQTGAKKQVARGVMLTNVVTNIISSGDWAAWNWYVHERTAPDAQGEIRHAAYTVKEMIKP